MLSASPLRKEIACIALLRFATVNGARLHYVLAGRGSSRSGDFDSHPGQSLAARYFIRLCRASNAVCDSSNLEKFDSAQLSTGTST